MKTLKYIFAIFILSVSIVSCTDENDEEIIIPNPVAGLTKIYEFSETDHSIEIYSEKTSLEVGYNEIYIRIKDLAGNKYVTNAAPTWMPMMHMANMNHSAPYSELSNSEESTVYKGFIVFQMASNDTEYWDITLNYNFNGQTISKAYQLAVAEPAGGLKKVQVFMGSDETRYILAYVNPRRPQVAVNDIQAVLYRMVDMMTFPVVEDYKVTVDPRMPGMGNHTSPNNQDMTYNDMTKMYNGKLSLTMTGYWRINLKLLNVGGEVLKGEDVTGANPESSLYFELEF